MVASWQQGLPCARSCRSRSLAQALRSRPTPIPHPRPPKQARRASLGALRGELNEALSVMNAASRRVEQMEAITDMLVSQLAEREAQLSEAQEAARCAETQHAQEVREACRGRGGGIVRLFPSSLGASRGAHLCSRAPAALPPVLRLSGDGWTTTDGACPPPSPSPQVSALTTEREGLIDQVASSQERLAALEARDAELA